MKSFLVTAEERCTDLVYGHATVTRQSIVTNRPELVKVSQVESSVAEADNICVFRRQVTVAIHGTFTEGDGFVSLAIQKSQNQRGDHFGWEIKGLAGQHMPGENLYYGVAYMAWVTSVEEDAYNFLESIARSINGDTCRKLRFAAGRYHAMARHDHRRNAWVSFLQVLNVRDASYLTGSMRTATVKVAQRLGWRSTSRPPKYWEGLPKGVIEITL